MTELTPLQPIQVATLIIAIAIFFTTMVWAHYDIRRHTFPYLIGPITFSIHSIIFYSVLVGRQFEWWNTGPLTIWSAYLRFHGLATLLGVLLMIVYRCSRREIAK